MIFWKISGIRVNSPPFERLFQKNKGGKLSPNFCSKNTLKKSAPAAGFSKNRNLFYSFEFKVVGRQQHFAKTDLCWTFFYLVSHFFIFVAIFHMKNWFVVSKTIMLFTNRDIKLSQISKYKFFYKICRRWKFECSKTKGGKLALIPLMVISNEIFDFKLL